ncbi:MAG: peptide chain release factor-like protein [Kiritimatiellia bacterium]|jgi:protein subunit release factor B|nr:peptide chain release factor-like protein [Kiritimatiellia bacterium]
MALASVFEEDLEESFILGSGPGGQKINKTASTVRLLHRPSRLTVKCGVSRSREQNRWLARRELAERILERERSDLSARRQATEKIRRQKRRRSRRQQARVLEEKRKHSEKKASRSSVRFEA